MKEAICCKNIFRDKNGTPDGSSYTRIWLELVKYAAERDIYRETQGPDGDE